jgi:hypothetical protein
VDGIKEQKRGRRGEEREHEEENRREIIMYVCARSKQSEGDGM